MSDPLPDLEARILLELDDVLAVDKPADLPTSGRTLDDPDCLQWHLMQRAKAPVWAVHQLDADTSGVNLFTRKRSLVEPLKRALAHDEAEKLYAAWVHGLPSWNAVSCAAPIGHVTDRSLGVVTGAEDAHGRPPKSARSTFAVESFGTSISRVEARIFTGRTHQIRIHLAHLGHPLVGEEWYREPPCTLHPRQALHARFIKLGPPFSLAIESPLPDDLIRIVDSVRT